MIGAHPGQRVGVEIFSAQAGRVAIDRLALALAHGDFGQLAFRAQIDPRVIHQFGDARHALIGNHQAQIIGRDARPGCFERGRRNAGRQHDKKIQRQVFA